MKRFLSIILALAMTIAILPAVSAEGETDTRDTVVVNFARCSGLSNSYEFSRGSDKGARDIDGTNFTTVDAETTSKVDSNTRNDNIYIKVDGSNYRVNGYVVYFLQVVLDGTIWDGKAWTGSSEAPAVNNKSRWTIEIDMGTTVSGWYDLVIRGANNYSCGIYSVYVDSEYVGDYDCRKAGADLTEGDHVVCNLGKVYVSPDESGKAKLSFVLKESAYTSKTDTTANASAARLLIEDITFTPGAAPADVASETISTELSWDTMYYYGVDSTQTNPTYAVPSENWITHGFELVLDKMTKQACRYTPQTVDKTKYFTQLETGASLWPTDSTSMFTIKKKVTSAGWYRVDVQGILTAASSDYAIYVNGEYAGDYNFDNTDTANTANKLGDKKKLNTVWLNSGENEISFRARTKNYSRGLFVPYTIDLVPANEPAIASVETTATAKTLDIGAEESFTAKVKMTDETYRSFGYNNDGSLPVSDDVVTVTSDNENVVEVVKCINVETVDASDISATVDPTTVTYALKTVGSGTADITVTAIVNGKTKSSEPVTITVPEAEAEQEKAPTVSFYAESSDNTNAPITVTATDKDGNAVSAKTLATLLRGAEVTVTAPETQKGYTFRGWVRGSAENGRLISLEPTYTFNAMTHTMLTAVYTVEATTDEYYNWNGEFLGITDPGTPTLLGYVFDDWANNTLNNITRHIAQYTKATAEYNIEIPAGVIESKDEEKYYYDTEVTLTAEDDVFWLRDGKVVDFGKTYTFYVWGDTKITTADSGDSSAPKVFLDIAKGNARMIEYDKGDYKIVEVGILFGNVGDKLTVGSCDEKMNSQRNSDHGQFSAQSDYEQAKGYLIYQDGSEYKVIYSE